MVQEGRILGAVLSERGPPQTRDAEAILTRSASGRRRGFAWWAPMGAFWPTRAV